MKNEAFASTSRNVYNLNTKRRFVSNNGVLHRILARREFSEKPKRRLTTMAENRFPCPPAGSSRETVCIETNRVMESCRDRDCFENVRVYLSCFGNEILERTGAIRAKSACIVWTYIGIDPIQFNRGFYAVTIRFYVKITFEACIGGGRSQELDGIAVLEKRVILYGGESNVNMFKSTADASDYCKVPEPCCSAKNVPTAIVEAIVL